MISTNEYIWVWGIYLFSAVIVLALLYRAMYSWRRRWLVRVLLVFLVGFLLTPLQVGVERMIWVPAGMMLVFDMLSNTEAGYSRSLLPVVGVCVALFIFVLVYSGVAKLFQRAKQ